MKKLLIIFCIVYSVGWLPGVARAADLVMPKSIPTNEPAPAGEVAAKPTNCPPGRQCLDNPLAPTADGTRPVEITTIIGIIIKGALSVLGSVALVFFIKGGIKWLTSFGNSDMVKEGAMTMLYAALGVFLALGSYFLLNQYFALLAA